MKTKKASLWILSNNFIKNKYISMFYLTHTQYCVCVRERVNDIVHFKWYCIRSSNTANCFSFASRWVSRCLCYLFSDDFRNCNLFICKWRWWYLANMIIICYLFSRCSRNSLLSLRSHVSPAHIIITMIQLAYDQPTTCSDYEMCVVQNNVFWNVVYVYGIVCISGIRTLKKQKKNMWESEWKRETNEALQINRILFDFWHI